MARVALHRIDKVWNEVVTSLELNIDIGPSFVCLATEMNEAIVSRDKPETDDKGNGKDNPEDGHREKKDKRYSEDSLLRPLGKEKKPLTFCCVPRILMGHVDLSFFAMNSSIFKSNDIRALCPQDFAPEDGERIARTLAAIYRPLHVYVGRDMRETSLAIEEAVVRGFVSSGVSVTRIGLCSTPMFDFVMGEKGGSYDLGLMITASHNPAEYNGIKIVNRERLRIGLGSGLDEVRDRALSNEHFIDSNQKGQENQDIELLRRYLDHVFSLANLDAFPTGHAVVVDAGNGMEGMLLPEIAKRLPALRFHPLYWELDGRFPHHEANPLKGETLADLKERVKATKALCGFAFDGDADRIGVVDELGEQIPGDLLTALLASEIMRDHPGLQMIYDVRCSRIVAESVEAAGGTAEMSKVGTTFIKRRMRETGALFAGELSMHFYFSDFGNCESGDYVVLLVLQMLAREKRPLSELWKKFKRYSHSGERNYQAQNPTSVLVALADRWSQIPSVTINKIDGIRIDQWNGSKEDWWCNVRASNTEPLLRLNLETRDPNTLSQKLTEIESLLHEFDPTLFIIH